MVPNKPEQHFLTWSDTELLSNLFGNNDLTFR